jgi:hypothetical protein
VGNWMTEWERTGNTAYRDKILAGVDSLSEMPYGMFSGPGVLGFDPETCRLHNEGPADARYTSHLAMIMGGAEVCMELTDILDSEQWNTLLQQYCLLYNQPQDRVGGGSYPNWHARLTAYLATVKDDPEMARRAWSEFMRRSITSRSRYEATRVEGPDVLNPIDEVPMMSTNDTAQWCLNAIELLGLVGEYAPE